MKSKLNVWLARQNMIFHMQEGRHSSEGNGTDKKGTPSKAFLLDSYPQLPISCFPDLYELKAATEIARHMLTREILPITLDITVFNNRS